ncbi:MAG: hypothetical protein R2724_16495 [Bryobacterales bacterium]
MRTLLIAIAGLALAGSAAAQTYPLDSAKGFTLHNAKADSVTFQGKKAIKVVSAGEAPRGPGEANRLDHLVISPVKDFSNGTIEVDLAGEPGDAAGGGCPRLRRRRLPPPARQQDVRHLLSAPHQRTRRRPGAPQPLRAVHLAPRLALVPPSQGDAQQV